jgi:hypothetical protein
MAPSGRRSRSALSPRRWLIDEPESRGMLVLDALQMTIVLCKPRRGLLHRSEFRFAGPVRSKAYRRLLRNHGMIRSESSCGLLGQHHCRELQCNDQDGAYSSLFTEMT